MGEEEVGVMADIVVKAAGSEIRWIIFILEGIFWISNLNREPITKQNLRCI